MLSIYQQLQQPDQSVLLQARKILTQHIFGMVDQGECDEQRLTVGGLIHLKAVERDQALKSALDAHNLEKSPTCAGPFGSRIAFSIYQRPDPKLNPMLGPPS